MINQPFKFKEPSAQKFSRYWPEMVLLFCVGVALTFELVTKKTLQVIFSSRPTDPRSLKSLDPSIPQILFWNSFTVHSQCSLDCSPADLKKTMVFFWPWRPAYQVSWTWAKAFWGYRLVLVLLWHWLWTLFLFWPKNQ